MAIFSILLTEVSHGQDKEADLGAVAAVVHHVAPRIIGDPPERLYLAYFGKVPPAELWDLVSEIKGLETVPPTRQLGTIEDLTEVLDIWKVRREESGELRVSTQVLGPHNLAVEGCTYAVELNGKAWRVNPAVTRCVVL